ncbi:hypothetical protein SAMN02745866_01132 [Alteromonadaceae bacterium Bs31]|nr:hypothetical protein SAMN02745866_01132 [Alteromonadaceae bacterium Bs31]
MFIGKNCNKQVHSNQPSFLYPFKKRLKQYPKRLAANTFKGRDAKLKCSDEPGGTGLEIAKEMGVCKSCYDLLEACQNINISL